MLTKLWAALSGYKTHIIAWGALAVVLLGHFAGPLTIGSLTLPQFTWSDVMAQLTQSGLFSALRAGVAGASGT